MVVSAGVVQCTCPRESVCECDGICLRTLLRRGLWQLLLLPESSYQCSEVIFGMAVIHTDGSLGPPFLNPCWMIAAWISAPSNSSMGSSAENSGSASDRPERWAQELVLTRLPPQYSVSRGTPSSSVASPPH
ncbi:PREDICTED: uncharacterized protein LOC105556357 [Vollenhovia emeryi]|uniref:uncharacterized protein LOC105556357 n=1 Tax=Vollenhovia emeryi TaxID=411798 RepID=UPI0005F3C2C3|nr:PREDICTED: uncharacterized protein LOC105556357 [Vollenhovia emeryi]